AGLDSSVGPIATQAAGWLAGLMNAIPTTSSNLMKANAALALLAWNTTTPVSGATIVGWLESSQQTDGSWDENPYTTAMAIRARAALLGTDTTDAQVAVPIADFGLRSAINTALGQNKGDLIRAGAASKITSLSARGLAISDLSGLSGLSNLVSVDLRD